MAIVQPVSRPTVNLNKNHIKYAEKEKKWRVMLHPSRVSAIISPRHDFGRLFKKACQDRQMPACSANTYRKK